MASPATDLLRYWLASVRLEESLRVRPRARRTQAGSSVPRLDHPSAGQEYFKLPRAELERLLGDESVTRSFDAELALFFESWLLSQYRRAEDAELAHLLCFPVVHLARGELAGLLRRGVKLRFSGASESFRVPKRRDPLPAAPDRVVISPAQRSEESWPFFIDTRLLSYPLGVASEHIDALFERLRGHATISESQMLAWVASTLEDAARDLGESAIPGEPLARMLHAMRALLRHAPMRAEVYPLGIIVDGTQAKTTWHLQRELASLLEDAEFEGPLATYLGGHRARAEARPQRALYPAPTLTEPQRTAAELFWGSELSAVCGPPGTGKTTLVLHLCADAIVRQVDALLDRRAMGAELLLITSSNNRAVDNVIDPLSSLRPLPVALRVGSRQVCELQLAAQLRGVRAWLAQAEVEPSSLRREAYERALAEYVAARARVDQMLAPQREARERKRIEHALAALPVDAQRPAPQLAQLAAPLRNLVKRVEALSELCAAKPTMAHANAIARHYEKTAARELHALETSLAGFGMQLDVPLPPLKAPLDVSLLMEAWEDGAETFLARLEKLSEEVTHSSEQEKRAAARQQLERELAALGPNRPLQRDDTLSHALFEAAVALRESWAKLHAETLLDAVDTATEVVEQERSLRPLFRDAPAQAKLLCQLFGVWGSTLLSLGNCLPTELAARVIIDEAGQCHPAHAVSALMRAKSALALGDVHQLPPVIDLTLDDDARLRRGLKLGSKVDARHRLHTESQVSAQSLADEAVEERHTLIDHYRCHPQIIAVSDALCGYGLRTHPPAPDAASIAAQLPHPLCLRDLRGEQQRYTGSLCNELELQETVRMVMLLLARGVAPADIAVITPYRGQLDHLRRALAEQRVPLEQSEELELAQARAGLALGTVHRFQGGERSIVLFSAVITSPGSLGFLNQRPNLLNVAISRAQQHFVCLGHRETLRRGPLTRVLVEAAHEL